MQKQKDRELKDDEAHQFPRREEGIEPCEQAPCRFKEELARLGPLGYCGKHPPLSRRTPETQTLA